MKKIITGFFILFSFNCLSSEIAVIDVDFLFKNSKQGMDIQKDFEKLNKDMLSGFNKKEKGFREEEQKILSKKNVLSETEYKKEVQEFEKKIKEYNQKKQEKLKEYNLKKTKAYAELYKEINIILVDYSKENNISTTFDKKNVVMTKSENDITKKILEILNKKWVMDKLNKEQIRNLLPHREPMLLIDELINIKKLHSATAIMNVKKNAFYVMGHFPENPVMPGVLIVEAFGQAAAALTAAGIDKKEYENKLVFLMNVEKARFRNPVIPDCKLELNIEAIRSHGRVWKYKGEAFVDNKKMADAQWSATIVDRK